VCAPGSSAPLATLRTARAMRSCRSRCAGFVGLPGARGDVECPDPEIFLARLLRSADAGPGGAAPPPHDRLPPDDDAVPCTISPLRIYAGPGSNHAPGSAPRGVLARACERRGQRAARGPVRV
jgi:hypothetical protein